jgi:hypothetical protein
MLEIAHATGGVARFNNDLSSSLLQACHQGESYYTISYAPIGLVVLARTKLPHVTGIAVAMQWMTAASAIRRSLCGVMTGETNDESLGL